MQPLVDLCAIFVVALVFYIASYPRVRPDGTGLDDLDDFDERADDVDHVP